jgi:formate/nitrite transporter FocA (FNT family)
MAIQTDEQVPFAPELTDAQEVQSRKVESTPLPVIHEVIRRRGEEELSRSVSALAWSGLAAGLSMGFSLIGEGLLKAFLPHASWTPLVTKIGYSFGFVVVILGRQQLFTENTLTPVIPVLAKRAIKTVLQMLRLWAVVLISNLVGAFCVAWVLAHSNAFEPAVKAAFSEIGQHAIGHAFGVTLLRGIFAGWLIALVVWLMPAVPNNRLWVIVALTWLVGVGDLSHVIAGAVETMYVVTSGAATWSDFFFRFMFPALFGNIIGGVSLVALINHAQLVAGHPQGDSD